MSTSTSASSLLYRLMPPPAPAFVIAEFATICPSGERTLHTSGRASPAGQRVTKFTVDFGSSVTFKTYAFASEGTPHTLDAGSIRVRVSEALTDGGPNAPVRPSKLYCARVSISR